VPTASRSEGYEKYFLPTTMPKPPLHPQTPPPPPPPPPPHTPPPASGPPPPPPHQSAGCGVWFQLHRSASLAFFKASSARLARFQTAFRRLVTLTRYIRPTVHRFSKRVWKHRDLTINSTRRLVVRPQLLLFLRRRGIGTPAGLCPSHTARQAHQVRQSR